MNPRRWALIYAACAALAIAAASVGGWALLRVSASERAAIAANVLDQAAQAALKDMDAELIPLLARESARPHFEWRPFYSARNAYTGDLEEIAPGAVLVASPLLTARDAWGGLARLYFEVEGSGELSSPQAPEGNALDLAESGYASVEQIADAADRLGRLRTLLGASADPGMHRRVGVSPRAASGGPPPEGVALLDRPSAEPTVLEERSVEQGPLAAMWIGLESDDGPELIVIRAVRSETRAWVQGIWLDWPRLRARLEGAAAQSVPGARAVPIFGPGTSWEGSRMITAPIGLQLPAGAASLPGPSVGVLWTVVALVAGVAAGLVGVGIALRSAVDLAGRRGRFVSAVTHELRTPLTTFRLYSQMLASGMVRDEGKRTEYLRTIEREADRLHGIVESVLTFARLGRGRGERVEAAPIAVAELVSRATPAVEAAVDGAPLEIAPTEAWGGAARIDASAFERVMVNLAANAAKYAPGERVRLWPGPVGRTITVYLGDEGPGIPRGEERAVFNAFHRAKRDAGSATPGLGLGLALSREIARHHGGDLTLERKRVGGMRGAVFALRLPGG